MALTLLRHPRPEGGDGICYGRTDLPVLSDPARDAAAVLGTVPVFRRIVSSPLIRASGLAHALAGHTGMAVTVEPRLQEMDFGAWEGRPWNDIPKAELDLWADDLLDARPHGGESVRMMAGRVAEALADQARAGTLIVTHMGVIRAALWLADRPGAWETRLAFLDWITLDPAAFSRGSPPASG